MAKAEAKLTRVETGRSSPEKKLIENMLHNIDVVIGGKRPWDIHVHHPKMYSRVVHEGALGLGEAYMDRWWDCERLDLLFERVLRAQLDTHVDVPLSFKIRLLLSKLINFQTKDRARAVAHKHYNLGNELFCAMLDPRMIYSCGYWKTAQTLEEAQNAKLELICEKLQLKPGMRLLDIGCGWGGLAKYAAEKYDVKVVGITISQQQCEFAQAYCKKLPIEIRLQDYRDINQKFDRVVSVGMFEHVGYLNYPIFMQTVHRSLHDNGLFLLHTIGSDVTSLATNPFINKYIFPNGMSPSIAQIGTAVEKLFVMEDWHNFSAYYDYTLMAWHDNFIAHWKELKNHYDERFFRMWKYYLLSCAGGFRARAMQLWQIVFSKNGIVGGYVAPR